MRFILIWLSLLLFGLALGTSESEFCASFEGEGGEDRLEMMRLYGEFYNFRDNPAFLRYGFTRAEYKGWQDRMDRLGERMDRLHIRLRWVRVDTLVDEGNMVVEGGGHILGGDIMTLALDYAFYGGPDSRWTRDLEEALDLALFTLKECDLIEP